MPPPLNIISFVFWVTAVSYRKLRRYLQKKAGEGEPSWKKKHRYTNIFGLYPPKIYLLTAEELSEMTNRRDAKTESNLPTFFQYVDAMKPVFARDLSTGINGSMGYTVEDIDDFEEMVTKNALEQVETVSMILIMVSKLVSTRWRSLVTNFKFRLKKNQFWNHWKNSKLISQK